LCPASTLLLGFFTYYSAVKKKNIVGPTIKAVRKEAQVSQMRLAAELQLMGIRIDRTAIAKLESGKRPATDIEIFAIAKILNISIQSLFEDSGELFGKIYSL